MERNEAAMRIFQLHGQPVSEDIVKEAWEQLSHRIHRCSAPETPPLQRALDVCNSAKDCLLADLRAAAARAKAEEEAKAQLKLKAARIAKEVADWARERLAVAKGATPTGSNKRRRDLCGNADEQRRDRCPFDDLPHEILVRIVRKVIATPFQRGIAYEETRGNIPKVTRRRRLKITTEDTFNKHKERILTVGRLSLVSKHFQGHKHLHHR